MRGEDEAAIAGEGPEEARRGLLGGGYDVCDEDDDGDEKDGAGGIGFASYAP